MNTEIKEALSDLVKGSKANTRRTEEIEDQVKGLGRDVIALTDEIAGLKQKGVKMGVEQLGRNRNTLGKAAAQAEGRQDFLDRQSRHLRVEVKNTILGEGGSPQSPSNDIVPLHTMPGVAGGAFRPLTVVDLLPRGETGSNQVHYTRETAWSNGAAETAEGATKQEATLTFAGIDAPVRTVAHWIKTSVQVLEDAPALQAYIDGRMKHGVEQRLEEQVIAGDGTDSNMSGLTDTGNHTDLTVVTGDNDLDAASRAKYQVIGADFQPSLYIVNPEDWGRMERKRTGISSDETPVAGAGNATKYLADGMQPMLWGLPVAISKSMPEGEFICMSRDAVMLWDRQLAAVEFFAQDENNVQKNMVTIRAEGRWAFGVFAPAAVIHGAWPEAS